MITTRIHYALTRGLAYLAAPIMRKTGYRFSKSWRGNKVIDHVAANSLADGIKPEPVRFN